MSFSSFYIGATGMKTHAQGLQIIGNNLANVNTVGYKESALPLRGYLRQHLQVRRRGGTAIPRPARAWPCKP